MRYDLIYTGLSELPLTFLPVSVRRRMETKESFLVYASAENDEIVSIGAFSEGTSADRMELLWIYTQEAYREQGIASGLLERAEQEMIQMGVRTLDCQVTADLVTAEEMYEFLVSHGFQMQLADWHIYEYEHDHVVKVLQQLLPDKKREQKMDHLSKEELEYRLRKDETIPYAVKRTLLQEADPKLSLFWYREGTLMAGVAAEREENGESSIRVLYLNGNAADKAGILLQMLKQISQESFAGSAEKVPVYFCVDDEKYRNLYRKLFGVPLQDYWIQKYESRIG